MTTIKRTPDPVGVATLLMILVMVAAMMFAMLSCSNESMITRTYRYHYNFEVISGELNSFSDDQLHYPGDTIVFFPSKVKIVIVDVTLAKR